EIRPEGGHHPRRHANRGAVAADHHEARAVGAGVEWRGQAGAGDGEEIAPGGGEGGREVTLLRGKREVDAGRGHSLSPLALPYRHRGEGERTSKEGRGRGRGGHRRRR